MTYLVLFLKRIVSIVLSLSFSFLSPIFGDYYAANKPKDEESVRLTFAAISDIHMRDNIFLGGMLETGLYDMENAEVPLDALVFCGDNTNHGYEEEYEMLYSTIKKYNPAKQMIFAEGNHDTWTESGIYDKAETLFTDYASRITGLDIQKVYYSTKINGYTFIVLGSEGRHTDAYISDTQLEWLEAEMQKASADGLPIFVISHWPINLTHGLPSTFTKGSTDPEEGGFGEQSDKVEAILKKYENVFLISGHIHTGFINDTFSKLYGYSSVESDGSFHSVNLPSFMYVSPRGRVENGTGYQIEVYDTEVVLRARSFAFGVWYPAYECSIPLA